jgi:hypothetical protein
MSLERSNITVSANWFVKNADRIKYDLAIQRNEVWSEEQKSLLIHSLAINYPIPPMYAIEKDDSYQFLDGKQRGTSLQQFLSDKFALSKETPDVNGVEIAGLKYSELPEEVKDEVRAKAAFLIYKFKDITEEEIEQMFLRLNGGVPLTKMELNRVTAGSDIMNFIQEIANEVFFKERISLSEKMVNRFVNEEVLFQILMLMMNNNEAVGLSSKDIKEFILKIKDVGIPEDIQKSMREVTRYLGSAFPVQESYLKKLHVPMIFLMAIQAQKDGIECQKFSGWVQDFFSKGNKGNFYFNSNSGGTAKKENVAKRISRMQEHYNSHIVDAKDYIIPTPKHQRSKIKLQKQRQ